MGLLGTRRRRAAAGAMAGLCALGFAACFLLEDESPPDNADLILVRRFVPDGENGFLDIDFGKEALYWPSDAELRGGDEDPETDADPEERFAPEIVARNAEGLRKLEACLEKKDFQMPAVLDALAPGSQRALVWLSRTLLWRSRLHARAGREREALDDAVRLLRLGRKVLSAQGLLIDAMLGFSFQSEGLGEIRILAGSPALSAEDLASCLDALKASPPERIALADTLREEYRVWVAALDRAGSPDGLLPIQMGLTGWREVLFPWAGYRPNRTRRRFGDGIRRVIGRVSAGPLHEKPAEAFQLRSGVVGYLANGRGDLFAEFLLTGSKYLLRSAASNELDLEATRAVVAIRVFEKSKGHLPETLGDLVPDHLDKVPQDPFDGNPLRYSPSKRIVYSIGRDLVDGGGEADDCARGLEPTFGIGG